MTTRFADLGIKVHTTGAKEGKSELDSLTGAAARADAAVDGLADASKKANPAVVGMTRKVNDATRGMRGFTGSISGSYAANIRMFAQQLSQVGQQGAATGNYFQALTLQAADMGAAFGVAGIAAGTVLTVLGPMATELLFGEQASSAMRDSIDDLGRSLADVDDLLSDAELSFSELRSEMFGTNRELRDLANAQRDIGLRGLADDASLLHQSLSELYSTNGFFNRSRVEKLTTDFGMLGGEVRNIALLLDDVGEANTLNQQVESVKRLRLGFVAAAGEVGNMTSAELEFFTQIVETEEALRKVLNRTTQVGDATGVAAGEASRLALEANAAADAFLRASANSMSLQRAMAGLSIPFSDAMADLDFELSTAGMSAADKLVATRVKRLEETMRSASENAFGFDYGLTAEQQSQLSEYEKALRTSAGSLVELRKAGASASQSALSRLMGEISYRETLIDLTGDERKQYEALRSVHRRLGRDVGRYSEAQLEGLADRLVALEKEEEQLRRLADFSQDMAGVITGALFDPDSAADAAKDMIRQIAHQFTQNQIVLPIVGQLTGVLGSGFLSGGAASAGGVGQSAGGLLQGAGGLANLLSGGGVGAAAAGVGSGLAGVLSGGGLGASFANLGGLLSGAAAGWGAVGAAIPAVAAVAAAISFFSSKTKLLDSGLRITVDNVDTLVESFKHLEKRRFWGLSKKRRYEYSVLQDDEAEPYVRAIDSIWDGVLGGAEVLGVASSAWDDFTSQITVSTKGLSEEEAAEAVQEALSVLSDEMAGVVPGLEELIRYGETATNTLTRLSTSLVAVNDVFDLLGHSAYEANIAGGELASQLVDLFGGVDAMAGATNTYFAAFYTEAERLEIQTRRVSEAFGELGISLPTSREEFRALVEALDLTTSGGQEMYAAMLSLSGALDQVLPQVSSLTSDIAGIISGINGEIGLQMDAAREAQRNAESAARLWFRTAETLRDFIRDISGNSQLSGLGLSATHEINRSRFGTAFEMARGGDIDAASDIPALARSYLETARQSASTDLEYRRIAAQVQGQVAELGGIAALEGAQDGLLRALHEQQIDVLTSLQTYLNNSAVTEEGLDEFSAALDNLDAAITDTAAVQVQSLVGFGGVLNTTSMSVQGAAGTIGGAAAAFGLAGDATANSFNAAARIVAGAFDDSGSALSGSIAAVGDQIGIHLSDFVLGIPSEMDLNSNPLQSSLDQLRAAIEADAAERERVTQLAQLQVQGASVANTVATRASIGAGIVADIEALEARTGVQLMRNGNLDATLNVGAQGYVNYVADYFSGPLDQLDEFRAAFYGPNGLQAQIGAHNARAVSGIGQLEALRQQIRALRGIPSFDGGGFTGYGPRTGGLDGKGGFLSLLHRNEVVTDLTKAPSYRPAAGFGENRVIEGLLRRILKENAEERSEKRQLLRHIAISNERILKLKKRREAQSEANA